MILSFLTLWATVQEITFAEETTDITGTITARRQGAVKVEFKAHPKAGPKVGDRVDFKTEIQGFEANAGKGEVIEVEPSHVWVKVLEKNPKLKMTGIIHATGLPVTQKNGSPEAGIVKDRSAPGWLGVVIHKITPDLVRYLGLRDSKGALVGDVTPGGPAAKGGIKRGDVIVGFDNKEVADVEALPKIVAQTPVGSTVNVDIIRNGTNKVIKVTLAENWFLKGGQYYEGKDYSQAMKWFRKAAEQGHQGAQFYIGLMYEKGLGVPKDYAEARKWYRKAAEQGNEYAKKALARLGN